MSTGDPVVRVDTNNSLMKEQDNRPDDSKFIFAIFFIIIIMIILLSSCTRYAYYATETKITIAGQRIHMQELKKAKPIGDTTVTGVVITKKRIR